MRQTAAATSCLLHRNFWFLSRFLVSPKYQDWELGIPGPELGHEQRVLKLKPYVWDGGSE